MLTYLGPYHVQRFGRVGFRIALDFNVEPAKRHKLFGSRNGRTKDEEDNNE
jgi:hypothetical protein